MQRVAKGCKRWQKDAKARRNPPAQEGKYRGGERRRRCRQRGEASGAGLHTERTAERKKGKRKEKNRTNQTNTKTTNKQPNAGSLKHFSGQKAPPRPARSLRYFLRASTAPARFRRGKQAAGAGKFAGCSPCPLHPPQSARSLWDFLRNKRGGAEPLLFPAPAGREKQHRGRGEAGREGGSPGLSPAGYFIAEPWLEIRLRVTS